LCNDHARKGMRRFKGSIKGSVFKTIACRSHSE
jgi:hypothetical protein